MRQQFGAISLLLLVSVTTFSNLSSARSGTAEKIPPRRPPKISDEEDHTIPPALRCPACTAVFWEIDNAIHSAETSKFRSPSKVAANAPLAEHEYLEIFEVRFDEMVEEETTTFSSVYCHFWLQFWFCKMQLVPIPPIHHSTALDSFCSVALSWPV